MSIDPLIAALEELEPKIRAYFRRRCIVIEDIEDLVQECMAAAFEGFARYKRHSSISTWIYAICRNTYLNHVYYANRDRALRTHLREGNCPNRAEEVTEIRLLIDALPGQHRQLYRLYYEENRTIREIAGVLKRPQGTIKYLLYTLRQQLKNHLG